MKRILKKILGREPFPLVVGVLALQGNFKEHADMLAKLEVKALLVKLPSDLNEIDGLIIPGGESTTLRKLMHRFNLDKKIIRMHKKGMPIFGTCAGAILLAREIINENSLTLNLIDISLERNAYGRQAESFSTELEIKGIGSCPGIFIRSPIIKKTDGCEILASFHQNPVLIRKSNVLLATFHPELTKNTKIHEYFLSMAKEFHSVRKMHKDLES